MFEWIHDPDIQRGFQMDMSAKTLEDVSAFIEGAQYALSDGCTMHFAVANEQEEYLGTISLKDISLRDRRAEYAISLRKCAQGKG
ncbi:MAG: GNAT family N-acetyltransferase, partial [Acetatifactor sp.]|nr:GNAT family N-acetyltransferase [Acetatifactor sp.]